MRKIKNIIDDGFNAKLVKTAIFDGLLEIPVIHNNAEIIIPQGMVPFSERNKSKDKKEFVCFYEHDIKFRNILTATKEQIEDLKRFPGVISPDCSLYRDMPLVLQMMNVYLNRQVGHYLQAQGIYVIPNIRWGDERSYTRLIPTELPFAFLGVEKGGIYSIGTYGCIQGEENTFFFREGLISMLKELEPKVVIVYGAMPKSIFSDLTNKTTFIQIDDWIKRCHGGK